ncbi:hypothetical protein LJC33_00530 [Eubacteriales bacterium OttesenSCG-928-N13]|nr:hypothetical protein [Eubacteriales bacterium OttesenSCG-928-N13]
MPRILLLVLSQMNNDDEHANPVKCPGCGARLFDVPKRVDAQTALPTLERVRHISLFIKCHKCGRRIGVIRTTE